MTEKRVYFSLRMSATIDCPGDDVATPLQVVQAWAYANLGMPLHLLAALEVERVEEVAND